MREQSGMVSKAVVSLVECAAAARTWLWRRCFLLQSDRGRQCLRFRPDEQSMPVFKSIAELH